MSMPESQTSAPSDEKKGNWSRNPLWIVGCALLVVILFICALCSSELFILATTVKPGQSLFPFWTPTPTPNPNAFAEAESQKDWKLVFADDFISANNAWITGERQDPVAVVYMFRRDGVYHWQFDTSRGFEWWQYPTDDNLDNALLTVDVKLSNTENDDYCGLVARVGSDQRYDFLINNEQRFDFEVENQNKWNTLIDAQYSDLLKANDWNQLAIRAMGDTFTLYANGYNLATVEDNEVSRGTFGIIVTSDGATYDAGTPTPVPDLSPECLFDNYRLWKWAGATPTPRPTQTPTPRLTATPRSGKS